MAKPAFKSELGQAEPGMARGGCGVLFRNLEPYKRNSALPRRESRLAFFGVQELRVMTSTFRPNVNFYLST